MFENSGHVPRRVRRQQPHGFTQRNRFPRGPGTLPVGGRLRPVVRRLRRVEVSSSNARSGCPAAISSWSTTCSPVPRWHARHVFARTSTSARIRHPHPHARLVRILPRMRPQPRLGGAVARLARHPSERDLLRRTRHVARRAPPVPRRIRDLQDLRHPLPARIHQRLIGARVLVRDRPGGILVSQDAALARPSGVVPPWQFDDAQPPAPMYESGVGCAASSAAAKARSERFSHSFFTGRSVPPPAPSPAPRPPRSRGTAPSGSTSPPPLSPRQRRAALDANRGAGFVSRRARRTVSPCRPGRSLGRLRGVSVRRGHRGRRRCGAEGTRPHHHVFSSSSPADRPPAARAILRSLAPPGCTFPSRSFSPTGLRVAAAPASSPRPTRPAALARIMRVASAARRRRRAQVPPPGTATMPASVRLRFAAAATGPFRAPCR